MTETTIVGATGTTGIAVERTATSGSTLTVRSASARIPNFPLTKMPVATVDVRTKVTKETKIAMTGITIVGVIGTEAIAVERKAE